MSGCASGLGVVEKQKTKLRVGTNERCFNCGKKRPPYLEIAFHNYYESESCKNESDTWIQFEGWTEFFLDPAKIRSEDDQQLWFISLCPKCSDNLEEYLRKPANDGEGGV